MTKLKLYGITADYVWWGNGKQTTLCHLLVFVCAMKSH